MSNQGITISAAFLGGLLSFLSPCVLPLVPAYLSYMSGTSVEELLESRSAARRTGLRSIAFVLGFSVVFVALGATATSAGQLLNERIDLLTKLGGAVVIVFGLHMLGIFRIKALYSEKRLHARLDSMGPAGAFLIGVTFAFGWTPCIGPVLGAILVLAANSETVFRGVTLLAVYSLGLGIPFLAAGFATAAVLRALSPLKRHFRKVEIASGMLLIIIGVMVAAGKLQDLTLLLNK
ncbi:MAG: cytochrome c biogenesis CcdA family protein [Armatimonadota bacterium]